MSGKIQLDVLEVLSQLGIRMEKFQESEVLDQQVNILPALDFSSAFPATALHEPSYFAVDEPEMKKKNSL